VSSADNHRFVGQGRVISLLDLRIEGIAVDVSQVQRMKLEVTDHPSAAAYLAAAISGRGNRSAVAAEVIVHALFHAGKVAYRSAAVWCQALRQGASRRPPSIQASTFALHIPCEGGF